MTTSPQYPWERAERLDAGRMTDAVHTGTGVRLMVEGPVRAARWVPRTSGGPTATGPY
ncbi:hypothetical protein ACFQ2K_47175 [Streptomyces sanglieri]|uniref:Uncharacterized protein n=1 Tax=Streptomyces sanglieri TaxID=193460 RepID=A0ABW2X7W7_9ACTN